MLSLSPKSDCLNPEKGGRSDDWDKKQGGKHDRDPSLFGENVKQDHYARAVDEGVALQVSEL